MPNIPTVAVRRWIKWADGDPSEPTSTLVLTSSRSTFVDVRVFLDHHDPNKVALPRTMSTSEAIENCSKSTEGSDLSQLDWAFAGTSSKTNETENAPGHGKWEHWVDSKYTEAKLITDEGDLFPFQDGNEELELEKGSMPHPSTGRVTPYEEVWASNEDLCMDASKSIERICIVLIASDEGEIYFGNEGVTGVIIRLGKWVQGIIRKHDQILVERWAWEANDGNDSNARSHSTRVLEHRSGFWKQLVKIEYPADAQSGLSLNLPCTMAMTMAEMLEENQNVMDSDVFWDVKEVTWF